MSSETASSKGFLFILFLPVIVSGIASETYVRVGNEHQYLENATVFPDVSLALCAGRSRAENLFRVFRYFQSERLCISQGGWHVDLADMTHDAGANEMVFVTKTMFEKGKLASRQTFQRKDNIHA